MIQHLYSGRGITVRTNAKQKVSGESKERRRKRKRENVYDEKTPK